MKRLIRASVASAFVILALFFASPVGMASATTSTIVTTITVIGWLVPDAAHFSNTLILLIFPLMGMVVLSTMPLIFKRTGDVGVYFALGGLTLGAIASDLSTNASSTNAVPFAVIFVAALLLFLWWWNS